MIVHTSRVLALSILLTCATSLIAQDNAKQLREIATHADKFYLTTSYSSEFEDGNTINDTKEYYHAISSTLKKLYMFQYSDEPLYFRSQHGDNYVLDRAYTSYYFAIVDMFKFQQDQLLGMDALLSETREIYGGLQEVTFAKYIQHSTPEDRQAAAEQMIYLIEAEMSKGNVERAKEMAFRTRSLDSQNEESIALLADVYAALGRFSDAAAQTNILVQRNSTPAYVEKHIAMNYFAGNYAVVISFSDKLLETLTVLGSRARIFYFKGLASYLSGDKQGGLEALEAAYESNPQDPGIRTYYGLVLAEFGRVDEAIKIYERLVAQFPENANVLYSAAEIYYKKDGIEGCTFFRRAMRAGQAPTEKQQKLFIENCQ